MQPISHTVKDGVVHFNYSFSDLRKFITEGRKSGNVGMRLVRREGNLLVYRGFGTIERPIHHLQTISIMYNPLFDAPLPDASETPNRVSFSHTIIDFKD